MRTGVNRHMRHLTLIDISALRHLSNMRDTYWTLKLKNTDFCRRLLFQDKNDIAPVGGSELFQMLFLVIRTNEACKQSTLLHFLIHESIEE